MQLIIPNKKFCGTNKWKETQNTIFSSEDYFLTFWFEALSFNF